MRVLIDQPGIIADNDGEAVALVNVGSGVTNIVVEESGKPRFTRVAPLAGNNFTQRVAEALNVSFEEANELKAKVGLPSVEGKEQQIEGIEAEKVKQVQDSLTKELNKFVGEVRRSIDYYLTQRPGVKSIQSIILSGNGAKLKNLLPHLERSLQVSVELGHPLHKVQLAPKLAQETVVSQELGMSICLGLALRGLEE